MPLRAILAAEISSREATLRNGRCRRKDFDAIRVSIGRAQAFLRSYPVADDERVRSWCRDNREDVCRIVPASHAGRLAELLI